MISDYLKRFWDPRLKSIRASLNTHSSPRNTSLDISVLLTILHSSVVIPGFEVHSDKLLSTLYNLKKHFKDAYAINDQQRYPLIGRYPYDQYDGTGVSSGNPWLCLLILGYWQRLLWPNIRIYLQHI
jgi:hypothetical protein